MTVEGGEQSGQAVVFHCTLYDRATKLSSSMVPKLMWDVSEQDGAGVNVAVRRSVVVEGPGCVVDYCYGCHFSVLLGW